MPLNDADPAVANFTYAFFFRSAQRFFIKTRVSFLPLPTSDYAVWQSSSIGLFSRLRAAKLLQPARRWPD